MPKRQQRFSTEPFLIPVTLLVPEGTNVNTDQDVVEFQFIYGGLPLRTQPDAASWVRGYWLHDLGGLLAGINVGPGGAVQLGRGIYAGCVRVHDWTVVGDAPDTLEIL